MSYRPHSAQVEAHRNESPRRVLLWSRQTGKTIWAINESWIKGLMKQGRYMIIFATYRQAKDTIWNQYLHYLPDQLVADTNSTDLTVTLHHVEGTIKLPDGTVLEVKHDPRLPPTTIELKGSEDADKLRGMKANGIIFDEYAIQNAEHWSTVFEPMLSTTNGWAAFISTPKGFNHFYDMVRKAESGAKGWWISQATWRVNPAIDPEYIEQIKADAVRDGRLSSFMQEYELEFRSVEGAVYPEFKRDMHVIKPSEIPTEGTNWVGMDFGWAVEHPTGLVFIKIDYHGNWYIFDEVLVSKMSLDDIIGLYRNKTDAMQVAGIVADSARPDLIDYVQVKGLPVLPAPKRANSIVSGIQLIGQMLKPKIQILGPPKPQIYISSACPRLIEEFESYKYAEPKANRPPSEKPIKQNDHLLDALRYVALHLRYGVGEKDVKIKPQIKFNAYGL